MLEEELGHGPKARAEDVRRLLQKLGAGTAQEPCEPRLKGKNVETWNLAVLQLFWYHIKL